MNLLNILTNFVSACSSMDASMDEWAKPIYYSGFTFSIFNCLCLLVILPSCLCFHQWKCAAFHMHIFSLHLLPCSYELCPPSQPIMSQALLKLQLGMFFSPLKIRGMKYLELFNSSTEFSIFSLKLPSGKNQWQQALICKVTAVMVCPRYRSHLSGFYSPS